MKLTKKLIPAIGMLTLSMVMLVTSSFAWFSMNTSVKATGMTMSAKGDQVYLQIVKGTDKAVFNASEAQIEADAQLKVENLQPVDVVASFTGNTFEPYAGGKDFKWVTNTSKTADDYKPAGNYAAADATFYLKQSFMIRLNKAAGKTEATAPLAVSSVSFTTTVEDAFAGCVSVLVVCGNQSQLYKQTALGTFAAVANSDTYLDQKSDSEKFFANTEGVQVDVYVFFDGSDENCSIAGLNAATNNAAGYSVDVFFTCK